MKNKNILVVIAGLAIIAILILIFINRSLSSKTTSQPTTQHESLIGNDENTEGDAVFEFSINHPEDESSEESFLDAEPGLDADTPESSTLENASDGQQVLGEAEKKQEVYTFFYGETCGYCGQVIEWFEETGVESRLNIVRKEVYNNSVNSQQLSLAAQVCNTTSGGVPFLFTPDKQCVIGSTPIIDYLSEVAGV